MPPPSTVPRWRGSWDERGLGGFGRVWLVGPQWERARRRRLRACHSGQIPGCGFGKSIRCGAPSGTSLATTTTRLTLPSFRTRCPEAPPESTNVDPAGCTWGVHVGSSPSYSVAAPDTTITRLGPEWLCQPNVPPGTTVFCRRWRSEAPFVSILACE